MSKTVRRGYLPSDEWEFNEKSMIKMQAAAEDVYYLLNRGYHMKSASTFAGNHYTLSERQRLALARIVSPGQQLKTRADKCKNSLEKNAVVHIDGFNTIITLEIALSGSTLLKCMDGTVRDLAGLRGTYRLIDKTPQAVHLIGAALEQMDISKACFYLDAPVSNTGRLAGCIREGLKGFHFETMTEVINNVDSVLSSLDNVITSDAIILDKCQSWINLVSSILGKTLPDYKYISIK